MSDSMVGVQTAKCIMCGKTGMVYMPVEAFERWEGGGLIQEVWPEGTSAEREQLLNGTHGPCFEEMFADATPEV